MINKTQAEEIYKKYVAWLYRLVVEQKNNFDLIVAAADSGTLMAETIQEFYSQIKKKAPVTIILPIQRYTELGVGRGKPFDNLILLPELRESLKDCKRLKNILFVDDEIGLANTAKESIQLILKAAPKKVVAERVNYTILAENHGFEWRYDIPQVAIRFFAFSNKIKGVNGSVFEIIPNEVLKKFQKVESKITKKKMAALFTTGYIKSSQNNKPVLSDELLEKMELKVKGFDADKKKFLQNMRSLIKAGISDYKKSKIKLRDFS